MAAQILKFRGAKKQVEQVNGLLKSIRSDGRIHAQFNQTGTRTGRFSCKQPNLQNVPVDEIRSCFVARPGYTLIIGDYSQIELRIAAAITGENSMLEAFRQKVDLHEKTASLILNRSVKEVSKQDRQLAKAVNFGLIFGQQAKGLVSYAQSNYGVSMTEAEAQTFRTRYFEGYPQLKQWHQRAWRQASEGKVLEARTITGRRNCLAPGSSRWERFTAFVNTPVQGSCGDGMKLAMVAIARSLPEASGIVSTIHDELIVEAPESDAERVKEVVRQEMIHSMQILFPQVPIDVEIKVCRHWGEK